jgi:hypothetical protein
MIECVYVFVRSIATNLGSERREIMRSNFSGVQSCCFVAHGFVTTKRCLWLLCSDVAVTTSRFVGRGRERELL